MLELDLEHETALPRDPDALARVGAPGGQLRLPALAEDEHLPARAQGGERDRRLADERHAGASRRQAPRLPDARDHDRRDQSQRAGDREDEPEARRAIGRAVDAEEDDAAEQDRERPDCRERAVRRAVALQRQ